MDAPAHFEGLVLGCYFDSFVFIWWYLDAQAKPMQIVEILTPLPKDLHRTLSQLRMRSVAELTWQDDSTLEDCKPWYWRMWTPSYNKPTLIICKINNTRTILDAWSQLVSVRHINYVITWNGLTTDYWTAAVCLCIIIILFLFQLLIHVPVNHQLKIEAV